MYNRTELTDPDDVMKLIRCFEFIKEFILDSPRAGIGFHWTVQFQPRGRYLSTRVVLQGRRVQKNARGKNIFTPALSVVQVAGFRPISSAMPARVAACCSCNNSLHTWPPGRHSLIVYLLPDECTRESKEQFLRFYSVKYTMFVENYFFFLIKLITHYLNVWFFNVNCITEIIYTIF